MVVYDQPGTTRDTIKIDIQKDDEIEKMFETAIISELMLYLRVLEAPSKAGMYLDKLMTASGISAINISVINHTARDDARYRHVLKGDDDGVYR